MGNKHASLHQRFSYIVFIFITSTLSLPVYSETSTNTLDNLKNTTEQLQQLPQQATDKAVDTAKDLAKEALPDAVKPVLDSGAELAKSLANIASGKAISDAIGSVLNPIEKLLAETINDNSALRQRVTTLESDNTKQMIDIEHLKAQITQLQTQQQQLQTQLQQEDAAIAELLNPLRQRIDQLEKERGTHKAPFKVVDAAGKTLLSVAQENNVLSLTLGEPGKAMTRLLVDGDAARVVAISKGNASIMSTDANHSRATFTSDAVRTTVGATEDGVTGLLVSQAEGDQAMGELALRTGKKFALRLYSEAGQVIAAGGENPTTAGTGLLYIGNGQKNLAALAADDQGGGLVHAFAPDGSVGSGLVGAERLVAAYSPTGTAIASMGKSDKSDGGNITTRDPSGDGVFSAGFNSAVGGGDACVYRAKRQNTFCLGIGLPGMMGTMGN